MHSIFRMRISLFISELALIYLRFSGFITFNDDGKIQVHFHRPPPFPLFSTEGPPRTIHPSSSEPRGIGWFSCAKITRNSSTESEQLGITNATPCDHCFPSSNTHVERVARRIMWYPLGETLSSEDSSFPSYTLISSSNTTVYAVVVIPVAICRMGVLAGWQPPFGLLVFSGICFASSGNYSSELPESSKVTPSSSRLIKYTFICHDSEELHYSNKQGTGGWRPRYNPAICLQRPLGVQPTRDSTRSYQIYPCSVGLSSLN